MRIAALTGLHLHSPELPPPHPLLSVLAWELRRFRASRLFWLQALGFFGFLLFLTWAQATGNQYAIPSATGFIAETSPWGLLLTLPTMVVVLVFFLLFVNVDGVTRDLNRRTHELLMTTAVPGWAYIWGRYLIGLMMSLGLAVLLLAALLGIGVLVHLTNPAYPAPQVGTVLLLWGGIVVPATVLASSLSFVLGTIFPRQSTLVKIGIPAAWFIGAEILPTVLYFPAGATHLPTWFSPWDPTSTLTALVTLSPYSATINQPPNAPPDQRHFQHLLNTIANRMPEISAWLAPHLILAGLSLALVVLATVSFRRFRSAFRAA